jgi:F0F1-type ATP synthase membrane subunit b/b'
LTTHFETVDKLKEEKNNNYESWFKNASEEFDNFYTTAQNSIKINEELYREKLRLEAPADYWKKRASKLKTEGDKYLNWLIKTSVTAAALLFILLMSLGTKYFEEAFNDRIKGIKWSIILLTIVSLLAFTIKILSKMTFSSFHLSRDAEEREQLTHFYLALKKDTAIEPEERQLILQSLFSRADTGLLKDDSSPTMPTSIIEKFSGAR